MGVCVPCVCGPNKQQGLTHFTLPLQIAKLTQQVKTLERENGMLRQIIKNIQNPGDRSVPDAP